MVEKFGDIWSLAKKEPDVPVVITTNGFVKGPSGLAVMGAGIAKQAKEKWPSIEYILGSSINTKGNITSFLGVFDGIKVISFPTKHVWWEKSDLTLIEKSARMLVVLADKFKWPKVLMTRPGCGNGKLKWEKVKLIIEPLLDDRFIVVNNKKDKINGN